MKYIELTEITKSFNNKSEFKTVIEDLNLNISDGDFVVLQGKNGSGKTTLINLILGLTKPNSGTVKLFDQSPQNSNSKNRIGVVLQSVNVPQKVTVKELINLIRNYYPNSPSVEEIINIVNLQEKADDWANSLSGGQKQRLYFALALSGNPDLLILDEPTRNLDKSGCEDFWQQVKQCRQQGITTLMVTNNQSDWQELDNLATRLVTLDKGKIVEDKNLSEDVICSQKDQSDEIRQKSIFSVLQHQIWFEIKQWYHDLMPIMGLIIFSGLITWLIPFDKPMSKLTVLIFAGIMSLTFAIDKVGSRIAAERIEGWEKLLRVTPLNPSIYIVSKTVVPILLIMINLLLITGLAAFKTISQESLGEWIGIFANLFFGIIPFLVLGIALGYLIKPKNFGMINGLSVFVAFLTCGAIIPVKFALKYLLVFSPFFHYSQLIIGAADLADYSNWMLNSLWLTWLGCIFSLVAIWAYKREQAIQS